MTSIHELDPSLEVYRMFKYKVPTSRLSRVIVTDRQTDTTEIIYHAGSRVVNKTQPCGYKWTRRYFTVLVYVSRISFSTSAQYGCNHLSLCCKWSGVRCSALLQRCIQNAFARVTRLSDDTRMLPFGSVVLRMAIIRRRLTAHAIFKMCYVSTVEWP